MSSYRATNAKTATSAASVPVLPSTAGLLAWALERAGEGRLWAPWTNVRRDLRAACTALGIEPVTPNDLRRTFGGWLRAGGAEVSLVGAALRHADSRMAERVYARLTPAELRARLVQQSSNAGAPEGASGPLLAARSAGNLVPRDGIEPPTRGFSSPWERAIFSADLLLGAHPVQSLDRDLVRLWLDEEDALSALPACSAPGGEA